MRTPPTMMIRVLVPFAPLFSERVFRHVQVLIAGAILTPGKRTISSALRAMGLDQHKTFHRYHRVLSRARWSSLQASRILLDSLVEAFVPEGDPLVVGVDETLERRQGKKIAAKGIYRDPARSSHSHLVKTSALRWVCLTLLAEVAWASRVWALPFVCALAPSERYAKERGRRHKKSLTEWAWQMLLLVRRWHPEREIVAIADGGYASLKLLERCRHLGRPITFITRLRLDAALYEPAPPRQPHQMGRPRLKGERLPNLSAVAEDPSTEWTPLKLSGWYGAQERKVELVSETAIWYSTGVPAVPIRWVLIRDPEDDFESQALLCTDLSVDPARIISWFVRRWQMESTFQEVRQRLGFETQRHWSEMAIQRTAPALLTLFSLVALFAHQRKVRMPQAVRPAAWYEKEHPTFSDALALVRKELLAQQEATFCGSAQQTETVKVPREFMERLTDAVCYAA
jgi:DDE superfamily endonuclease